MGDGFSVFKNVAISWRGDFFFPSYIFVLYIDIFLINPSFLLLLLVYILKELL